MTPAVTRLLKLFLRSAISLLLLIYVLNIGWPYVYRESVQDTCSFGSVSNEQYQGYLEDVKRRAQEYWPPLPDGAHPWPVSDDMQSSIAYRLNDATRDLDGFYERMAMSHAVLRAAGYRLREEQVPLNGEAKASVGSDGVTDSLRYVYGFTSPNYTLIPVRMFRFDGKATLSFIGANEQDAWVNSELTGKTKDEQIGFTFEELGFADHDPDDTFDFTFYPRLIDYDNQYRPCPAVPDAAWVEAYENTKPVKAEAPVEQPKAAIEPDSEAAEKSE